MGAAVGVSVADGVAVSTRRVCGGGSSGGRSRGHQRLGGRRAGGRLQGRGRRQGVGRFDFVHGRPGRHVLWTGKERVVDKRRCGRRRVPDRPTDYQTGYHQQNGRIGSPRTQSGFLRGRLTGRSRGYPRGAGVVRRIPAQALHGPVHALPGAIAVRIDLQRLLEKNDAGARGSQRSHHQPYFFQFRRKVGGLLGVLPGAEFIPGLASLLGHFERVPCGVQIRVHRLF